MRTARAMAAVAGMAIVAPLSAQVLYTNGPLVTHPGAGASGADVSAVQTNLSLSTYGFPMQLGIYRIADDFIVPPGQTWNVTTITLYGFQNNVVPPTPTINNVTLRIWNGSPSDATSTVLFGDSTTNRLTSASFANMYRSLDTSLTATTRAVFKLNVNVGTSLSSGTYWLDWSADGASSPPGVWQPPVTILGQTGKIGANALQFAFGSWSALEDEGTQAAQDAPFVVNGVSPCTAPGIVQQPVSQSAQLGQPVSFLVSPSGSTPLSYQWRKDGIAIANGGHVSGAATSTLMVAPVQAEDFGSYDCRVSNACGFVFSSAALLTAGCPSTLWLTDLSSLGPRTVHTVAWDSTSASFLSFGGRDGSTYLDRTQRWTGTQWLDVASPIVPPARSDHAMCDAPCGGVLVFGGKTTTNALYSDTWRFADGVWAPVSGASPSPRGGHAMVFDRARNQVVLFGGFTNATSGTLSSETWLLDLATSSCQWRSLPAQTTGPSPRFAHSMVYDSARQQVILFGGSGTSGLVNDTWAWNGTSWSVVPSAVSPPPRYYATLQWDASRQTAVLIGGWGNGGAILQDQWDLGANGWVLRPSPFPAGPIYLHAAASSPTGDMLVCGGASDFVPNRYASTWVGSDHAFFYGQPQSHAAYSGAPTTFHVDVQGPTPLGLQWRKDGVNLVDDGRIAGSQTATLTVNYLVSADAGTYDVAVVNACTPSTTVGAVLSVLCYGNCDSSTIAPILNVNDFTCFLNNYAAGNSYANCDGSTSEPVLNVNDFTCFLNKYAAGCP